MAFHLSKEGAIAAQQLLKKLVDPSLDADGDFGAKSKMALKRFQANNGLQQTGELGPATTTKLLSTPIHDITTKQLNEVMKMDPVVAADWVKYINTIAIPSGINTLGRMAAFLATVAVESGRLSKLVENMNYSAKGLATTWPKRFAVNGQPNALALQIERKPELIANHVYADRMGNGNATSGDGWKYRGRGPIALTGKANLAALSKATGFDFVANPEKLSTPEGGMRGAVWFWKENLLNEFADVGDFDGVSDEVNIGRKTEKYGDAVGYAERFDYYDTLLVALTK